MGDSYPPEDWLEAANRHATVAQLLSTLIHQVNNALQTIGGHAELLKTDSGVSETTQRRAATITGATDRTAEMLTSFQVFTRPPAGSAVHNLRDVAAQALAFRHYGLGRARIQATIGGAEQALVAAEAGPLMQAILNVILNSEQAMTGRTTEGRLTLDVGQSDEGAWLTVDDNGPGLSSPHALSMDSVFDTLRLGANNRLGIGLRIAHRIVTRLGGALTVGVSPIGGTRVRIELPLARR